MLLKTDNSHKSSLNHLDLLGNDEVALAKAFAFLLSKDKESYFKFLQFLDIKVKNTISNYYDSQIQIEKHRMEGRTDIELAQKEKYHVIVECKVNKGKVLNQRTQYLTSFNNDAKFKVLCFLTQERDTNKQIEKDVVIKNVSWLEIIELFNTKHFIDKPLVSEFLKFATKNYKMRTLKEILIQNVKDEIEINRFEQFGVYHREQTFGTPIYFAPYFTRASVRKEGISNLSKILGILTLKQNEIEIFRSDLEAFSNDKSQINKWIKGVKLGNSDPNKIYTYYFLDSPLTFKNPLKKDGGILVGRGKNWIAGMIPPNRCVSFTEFIKHIPELM